ncbi:hypothetical protein [Microlunatus sp. Y2014]|uniref:hypothetical protein n=1 Tax=Microlunatus sp. Y2014 TaxID=3418488 RepID=UPI003DA70E18
MTENSFRPGRRGFALAAGSAVVGGLLATAPTSGTVHAAPGRPNDCDEIDAGPLVPPPSDDVAAQVAAIDELGYWEGVWEGRGWTMTENGRMNFDQYERIQRKLSGELMVVEGKGTVRSAPLEVLFRAYATLGYDTATESYSWRALSNGGEVVVPFEVTDDGWAWELPLGGPARMRYESTFNGMRWHETGAFTPDGGQTWIPSLEFTVFKKRRCEVPGR